MLERMRRLDAAFAHPSKSYRTIHVAGTNGKGSVSTKIAATLTHSGYRCGLFTSPHLYSQEERIVIDGVNISPADLVALIEQVQRVDSTATFFETMTMAALLYFREQKVDFAVMEVGIGGTFDPTNIIMPQLSVITTISYDHKARLGATLEEIATNKAGIIKPGRPAILGYRAALPAMFIRALEVSAPLVIMPPVDDWVEENRAIARGALDQLAKDFALTYTDLTEVPLCRFQYQEPYLFDIAHNPDALTKLFSRIHHAFPGRAIWTIFGMSRDKELATCTALIKTHSRAIFPFNPGHIDRLATVEELDCHQPLTLQQFIQEAHIKKALILITGSAYIMGPAQEAINAQYYLL